MPGLQCEPSPPGPHILQCCKSTKEQYHEVVFGTHSRFTEKRKYSQMNAKRSGNQNKYKIKEL